MGTQWIPLPRTQTCKGVRGKLPAPALAAGKKLIDNSSLDLLEPMMLGYNKDEDVAKRGRFDQTNPSFTLHPINKKEPLFYTTEPGMSLKTLRAKRETPNNLLEIRWISQMSE